MKHLRALLTVAAFFIAAPAFATITVNNSAGGNGGATSQAVTISIPAGHTIVIAEIFDTFGNGGTTAAPTDSGGNAYTAGNTNSVGNDRIATFWSINTASAVTTVTAHTSGATGAGGYVTVIVWDISATGAITVPTSVAAVNSSSTTATDAITTGSMTVTGTDALLLGGAKDLNSNTLTHGTGYTADAVPNLFAGEHKTTTASGAATWTDSTAGDFVLIMGVALQAAAPAVTNGVLISNGHPVKSGSSILYK